MTPEYVSAQCAACSQEQQATLILLALAGEPMGRQRILDHLRALGYRLALTELAEQLAPLREAGLLVDANERGTALATEASWAVLEYALTSRQFEAVAEAYTQVSSLRTDWQGRLMLRSYRQGLALLRIALLRGAGEELVLPLLEACLRCHEANYLHPLIDVCARPFSRKLIDRIHPHLRELALQVLVRHLPHEPALAAGVRACAEELVALCGPESGLRAALAEHYLLCGRIDDAGAIVAEMSDAAGLFLRSVALLLRDEHEAGLAGVEQAIKQLRRETGKRRASFDGPAAHLAMLALLRSSDARYRKLADGWLDSATRSVQRPDNALWFQLGMLHQIRSGTVDPALFATRSWEMALEATVMRALIHHWLALPALRQQRERLEQALAQSELGGFDLWSAQLAAVLAHLGQAGALVHEARASALRARRRIADLCLWFAREEPWERQLAALIDLQPAREAVQVRESRLVWMIDYDAHYGVRELEPREQKRDAQGGWSRGRALGLKRLAEEGAQLDFLTAQDLEAVKAITGRRSFSGSGVRFEFDTGRAMLALVGHPLLFWMNEPATRVELLPGEPELRVIRKGATVQINLVPDIADCYGEVLITRETPTRLRLVHVREDHRRIAAIIGSNLEVPLLAERRILDAVGALSSLVTVQSDIGASSSDIEVRQADARLHLFLRPYQQGLRLQVLVRPLPEGACYAPGTGAPSVIADVGGVRCEARRDLNAERQAERDLITALPALELAEAEHDEWLLGQPLASLELVEQLRALDASAVMVHWPEGEKFRVSKKADSQALRIRIRRERDWFAASGELVIDEQRVIDLRTLLDKLDQDGNRFVALGENDYLALSDELNRRLRELAAFGELNDDGVRTHGLASFALDELARVAGETDADRAWRAHLEKIQASAEFTPELPTTLQAELRDYQHEGFAWLARLAHWGVGACLADDMGLGKTLQALALLLTRASGGPALVVAPTSVCLNWLDEARRFAPTLNLKLFGPGAREAMVAEAGPMDVVVVSYGLLQQEAPLFKRRRWHSIVLDEAQAIKNTHTKRSQAVMALQGDFRMAATGTPLENHLGELWNLFRFLNPGLLGNAEQFQLRFAGPIEKAQDKRAELAARKRLRRLVQPFILRRTKAQVLAELPPRTEIVVPVELSEQESAFYETLRRSALERIAALEAPESQASIEILAEMMRLRRACCHPELVAPGSQIASSKLATFARLVSDLLANGHKVLVFSQFVDHLTLIRRHLDAQEIRYQYLDGSTPMQERKKRVDAFQAGTGDLFLISLKAGGVGINLTAADYVIHMDPWWNPAVEDQASDRAHRMGQLRPVTIYRLVAHGTIEEAIVELHQHKRDLAESLLEGSDMAARMSPSVMLEMLRRGIDEAR